MVVLCNQDAFLKEQVSFNKKFSIFLRFSLFFLKDPFACSHQRAPQYYLESIRSLKGFWGWACSSYLAYMFGMCPPTNYLVEAGDNASPTTSGMFLIKTAESSPFAMGKWTDLSALDIKTSSYLNYGPNKKYDPLMQQLDQFGKLDSHFNNIIQGQPPYLDNLYNENWLNFENGAPKERQEVMPPDSVEQDDESRTKNFRRKYRPINSKFRRRDHPEKNEILWSTYKENLTAGIIDQDLFQLPRIRNGKSL